MAPPAAATCRHRPSCGLLGSICTSDAPVRSFDVEHLLEGRAAVVRQIKAALLIRPIRMSRHRDKYLVRVFGIDRDLAQSAGRPADREDASTSYPHRSICRRRRRSKDRAAADPRRWRRRRCSGSDSATAIDPIDPLGCESQTRRHVAPASVVFHTPPFTMPR